MYDARPIFAAHRRPQTADMLTAVSGHRLGNVLASLTFLRGSVNLIFNMFSSELSHIPSSAIGSVGGAIGLQILIVIDCDCLQSLFLCPCSFRGWNQDSKQPAVPTPLLSL